MICHVSHSCLVQTSYAACCNPYDYSRRLLLHFEPQLSTQRHTCLRIFSCLGRLRPLHAHSSSIQGLGKLVFLLLVSCQTISNDRLELLSKISTPKLREWGTNCWGQISYFPFYPSSGIAGSMPRPSPVRVRRHGPPRGFNVTTRSKGLPRFRFQQPTRLKFYVCCGPSHGRPSR